MEPATRIIATYRSTATVRRTHLNDGNCLLLMFIIAAKIFKAQKDSHIHYKTIIEKTKILFEENL